MTNDDSDAPAQTPPIVFGTDGWRARIGEDYTYENVRRCAQGVAEWARSAGTSEKGVVIAYDRRFASEFFAQAAAEVLLAYDIPVAMAQNAVPTQMTSYEVVERGAACGIMITASHNPYPDNGFKVKSPTGAAASPDMLAVFEKTIRDNAGSQPPQSSYADALAAGKVELYDPYPGYVEYTKRSLDIDRLKAADMHVLVEPMWGAGAGWIPRLLAGGKIRVTEIHSERNPWFGGVNPEPIAPNINESLGILAGGGYDLGLLLDGDADRAGAADEKGTFIHQLQVMGLLMYYLLEYRGLRQPVVSTINETSMVGRLGEAYDVPVFETRRWLQVRRPEDDRDRRDDGRRGVGRLRLRHAPARARRHLRRPAAARPVHQRARKGPLAGVGGRRRTCTTSRASRSTCALTSTSIAPPIRR